MSTSLIKGPLLSIVIPTKNRQTYALNATRQIRSNCPEAEIVISDNSDDDSLKRQVKDLEVTYSHIDEVLSSGANYNRALELASGEYVCVLGDDDGVLFDLSDIANSMSRAGIDALGAKNQPSFYWPDDARAVGGWLNIPDANRACKRIQVTASLESFIRDGCIFYGRFDFVRVYHGIAKRDLLETVYKRFRRYINGYSPDIYSALVATINAKNPVVSEMPVTIAGICPKSTSSQAVNGQHEGDLESVAHLQGHWEHVWHNSIPHFFSVETIWAESALTALDDGLALQIEPQYLAPLYARCLAKHPKYLPETLAVLKSAGLKANVKTFAAFTRLTAHQLTLLLERLDKKKQGTVTIEGVSTLEEAEAAISNHYSDKELTYQAFTKSLMSTRDSYCD